MVDQSSVFVVVVGEDLMARVECYIGLGWKDAPVYGRWLTGSNSQTIVSLKKNLNCYRKISPNSIQNTLEK